MRQQRFPNQTIFNEGGCEEGGYDGLFEAIPSLGKVILMIGVALVLSNVMLPTTTTWLVRGQPKGLTKWVFTREMLALLVGASIAGRQFPRASRP